MKYLFIICFLSLACDDECDNKETKCNKNKVQVCDMKNQWETTINCDRLDLKCCYDEEYSTHTCCGVL